MEKKEFFRYFFAGTITDISICGSATNRQVLILAQANGVLLDEHRHIQKTFSFNPCSDTTASPIGDGSCLIYCPGGGFSRVWAMDLDGKELWRYGSSNQVYRAVYDGKEFWRYNSSNQVYRVVRDPKGQFYVCTFSDGVRLLDSNGNFVSSLDDDLSDILFANQTTILTISADNVRRQLEVRDESFNITKSFPIAKGAFRLVAYNWPLTNALCYATGEHLICIGQDGKTTKQVSLGGTSTSVNGVIVQDDQGASYLALIACHKAAKARSTFSVIGRDFAKVYEETLPTSLAVSTLGTSNRLYVGVGSASVVEYQLRQK